MIGPTLRAAVRHPVSYGREAVRLPLRQQAGTRMAALPLIELADLTGAEREVSVVLSSVENHHIWTLRTAEQLVLQVLLRTRACVTAFEIGTFFPAERPRAFSPRRCLSMVEFGRSTCVPATSTGHNGLSVSAVPTLASRTAVHVRHTRSANCSATRSATTSAPTGSRPISCSSTPAMSRERIRRHDYCTPPGPARRHHLVARLRCVLAWSCQRHL